MATDERFKKKTEQVRILLDDMKKLSRFDNSTVPTLLRMAGIFDPYNVDERQALPRAFHKEGGVELFMKMLTSISPDASNVSDSLQRPMEWSVGNVTNYVTTPETKTTFVDCGGLKFLLSLLKHHACQGLVLRFESRNTLRFAATTLKNLSLEPELKSCFHQELAADVLACYLDVPDAPCKLSALNTLARIATEQDLDIICNAQGAISLLTDMVNRPSYKKYTALENILYKSKSLVKTLTLISITAGIRRKTEGASSSLDKKVLEELIPKLREKLKVEVEKRDYTLEWGDIAVHPTRRSVQKWPKARDSRIYVPYKVSVAFYDGDVKKIEEAALEFEKKTCVRFIPRSEEADYIYIHAWEGNWSFLGHQGGDQALSLEPGKVTKGVVLHELMHALGFHHEHCRSDRDDHVWVHNHNIKPDWVDAIVKTTTNGHNLTTPYDYSSILHYGATAGSKDGYSPTLSPKDTRNMHRFGGGHTLSDGDVLKIMKMYDCAMVRQQPVMAPVLWNGPSSTGRAFKEAGISYSHTVDSQVGVWMKPKDGAENKSKGPTIRGDVALSRSSHRVILWPKHHDGKIYIPYEISSGFYAHDKEAITKAAQEFEEKTHIRFHPRGNERDFVHIQALDGNWSFLGRQGGDQALSLEPGKVTKGTVLHEFMHALGFHHEHCRSDRDQHVWVLSDNVKEEWKHAIEPKTSAEHDTATPYDYTSIMHYSMMAGSVDDHSPTIIPKNPVHMLHVGHSNSLSTWDVRKVQMLYGYEMAAPLPPVRQTARPDHPASAGDERGQSNSAAERAAPVAELIGAWRKKTKKDEEDRIKQKEENHEKTKDPVRKVLRELKKFSRFDSAAVLTLECLLEELTAECSKEEKMLRHSAYKDEGGPDLLKKILDSPKPEDVRIPLLEMLSKIFNAVAVQTSEEKSTVHKSGDIAGDPSEEVVQWPKHKDGNVYIPYNISIAFNRSEKNVIKNAIQKFQKKTCVHFIPRTQELDYINFQALDGSWSFLGKKGGAQSVSLEPGKVDRGTVLHELMHALGFHHEHCRSDRDQHIMVHEDNIEEDDLCQFKRLESSDRSYGLPYDFDSILHYSRCASSIDGVSPTIVPIKKTTPSFGQRGHLSTNDVLKVQRMYEETREKLKMETERQDAQLRGRRPGFLRKVETGAQANSKIKSKQGNKTSQVVLAAASADNAAWSSVISQIKSKQRNTTSKPRRQFPPFNC